MISMLILKIKFNDMWSGYKICEHFFFEYNFTLKSFKIRNNIDMDSIDFTFLGSNLHMKISHEFIYAVKSVNVIKLLNKTLILQSN